MANALQELPVTTAASAMAGARTPAIWSPVPQDVDLLITAMEAGGHRAGDRRAQARTPWRVQASVRLFVDRPGHPARVIFTRDIHSRGLGFVTRDRLPLGYGGVVDLPTHDGSLLSIACTILRCRQAAPGWYEGLVYFNREQTAMERITG